jgi:hypothetical protein
MDARTNRQSFQQASEIADLQGRRDDSHLKRDPTQHDLPHKTDAARTAHAAMIVGIRMKC